MTKFEIPTFTVDAFTRRSFGGNPAAVCDLSDPKRFAQFEEFNVSQHGGRAYQLIAREMNLSETAFLLPYDSCSHDEKVKHFGLRWFTPTVEVPLCGHATLGTSHYVFENIANDEVQELVFHNDMSGELRVQRLSDGMLQMDFPRGEAYNVKEEFLSHSSPFRAIISDIFWRCFNLKSVGVEKLQQLPRARPEELLVQEVDQWDFVDHFVVDVEFCRRTRKLLLHVSCADLLFLMSSDSNSIGSLLLEINTIPKEYVDVFKGVIVTCTPSRENVASDELWLEKFSTDDGTKAKYDCATRYFAPWLGIPEDPVNGASHTVLVGYWTKQLGIEIVRAFQASTREGELWLELAKEENKTNRMYMRGYAVTVLKGSLCL